MLTFKNQKGFTLIELIIVLVILGILAAFAIPRFAALDSKARAATVNGLSSGMQAAAVIAHSACLANSSTCSSTAATATIPLEGSTINLAYGYPDTSTGGIVLASQINTTAPNLTCAAGTGTYACSYNSTCSATYTAATSSTSSSVAVVTSGC